MEESSGNLILYLTANKNVLTEVIRHSEEFSHKCLHYSRPEHWKCSLIANLVKTIGKHEVIMKKFIKLLLRNVFQVF